MPPARTSSSSTQDWHPQRVFLGWSEVLPAAVARWLIASTEVDAEGAFDLEAMLVVVPGRRAARRLLLALVAEAERAAGTLIPPVLLTPGALPERLARAPVPAASALVERLARLETLHSVPREVLRTLLPDPLPEEPLGPWLDLAAELERVDDELAAEGLDLERAVARLAEAGDVPGLARWHALASLARDVDLRLERVRVRRRAVVRLRAALGPDPLERSGVEQVVVAGVADLAPLFRRLLERVGLPTTVLVQAPAELAETFDSWGTPVLAGDGSSGENGWCRRPLSLERAELRLGQRPSDQAALAALRVAALQEELGAGEVAVVAGDPAIGDGVAEALRRLGVAVHKAGGARLAASEPAALLRALSTYLRSRSLADLGELLRQPAFEAWVVHHAGAAPEEGTGRGEAEGDWLTAFDRCARRCYSRVVSASGVPLLRTLDGAADALLLGVDLGTESFVRRRSLSSWAPVLAGVLERAYAAAAKSAPLHEQLVGALETIGGVLRDAVEPGTEAVATARAAALDLGAATTILLHALRELETAPEPGELETVEVLGWLEIGHDDAPAAVIVGLNEGVVPESVRSEPFLGEAVRRRLGLAGDARRHARDAFLLEATLHTRERVVLIGGRVGSNGEPLLPSRLLLQRAPAELAAAVLALYRDQAREAADPTSLRPPTPTTWPVGERSLLELPRPQPLQARLVRLPATAFALYLRCPYRFYLRQVLGIEATTGVPRELDPGEFGSLAHDVLRRFALGSVAHSADAERIEQELRAQLEESARHRYGGNTIPAVRVQLLLLGRRFATYARWQAEQTREGWRIDPAWVERPIEGVLEVDGEAFVVQGRVDRLDVHPEHGFRLVDFKTAEHPLNPEAHHHSSGRGGVAREWKDLQLPLYEHLLAQAGVARAGGDAIALGFYCLSKKLDRDPWMVARWQRGDLDEALEVARGVIRALRREIFFPPREAPPFDDGLGRLVGDQLAARYRAGGPSS